MHSFARLTLVGAAASPRADYERIAALPEFVGDARGFGYLYSAEDAACVELAECLGDRLWLTVRLQLGLGRPRALFELVRSHRYERVIAVVPASDFAAQLAAFGLAAPSTLRVIELGLDALTQERWPDRELRP